ncbi:cell division protein FtsQ/DivIB [uncultured Paracoccus sp.]|uniref:cell division protein FtsQ/DivIB n=1 Tax=uncultured Paracoccus sp. TaxID=189685 RepID=UPI00262D4039|nr:cell division protein FtsQ/DivIB [uncultured Paracoccus sp.]
MQELTRPGRSADWRGRPPPARPVGARPQPRAGTARRDPAPSRLAYRLHRIWLTPVYRRVLRVGLPGFALAMVVGLYLADESRRAELSGGVTAMIEKIQTRDEFMVRTMTIEGASPVVDKGLRAMLPVTLPASSFDIDLSALRTQVMKLDAVEKIELRIRPGGILSAVVTERTPALLWRHAGGIELLDAGGHRVASATARDVRPDLPMIAGEGAAAHTVEALALFEAAGPILPRLRGLQRMGERRWDVVLDDGQRIMLPERRPVQALEEAVGLHRRHDLLSRDVAVIDLRNGDRPALRLGLTAQNTLRRARGKPELGPDGRVSEPGDDKTAGAAGQGGSGQTTRPAETG